MSQVPTSPSKMELEHRLEWLIPQLQNKIDEHYAHQHQGSIILGKTFLSESAPPVLTVNKGRTYWGEIVEQFTALSVLVTVLSLRQPHGGSPKHAPKEPSEALSWMSIANSISHSGESFMTYETQKLIVELLNQELRKSDRIATLLYHEEVKEAKKDFITHLIQTGGRALNGK